MPGAAPPIGDRAYVLVEGQDAHEGGRVASCGTIPSSPNSISAQRRLPGAQEVPAMNLQFLVDGLLTGSMIGLGAIGVTLTYSILRFSNFAHGDFMAWGTYATLLVRSARIGAHVWKDRTDWPALLRLAT